MKLLAEAAQKHGGARLKEETRKLLANRRQLKSPKTREKAQFSEPHKLVSKKSRADIRKYKADTIEEVVEG